MDFYKSLTVPKMLQKVADLHLLENGQERFQSSTSEDAALADQNDKTTGKGRKVGGWNCGMLLLGKQNSFLVIVYKRLRISTPFSFQIRHFSKGSFDNVHVSQLLPFS